MTWHQALAVQMMSFLVVQLYLGAEGCVVPVQILDLSRGEPVAAFVHNETGLKVLGEWLTAAQASDAPSIRLAKAVLGVLAKLPIDLDALRISGIGQ